ncbi:MAG: hypothetical protein HY657_17965 [Acidobacteria bacterium]|nr:hypothetical protein [Acidobacteriota bacterium]
MMMSPSRSLLVILTVLCGHVALAQQASPFVRRSPLATPPVTSVEVVRQQRLEVTSPALLTDPDQSRVLQLDLFADVSFRALRERLEPTADGMSWIGVLEGYPVSSVVFVLVRGELMGHIYAPFGFFRIERHQNGSYLVQQIETFSLPTRATHGTGSVIRFKPWQRST